MTARRFLATFCIAFLWFGSLALVYGHPARPAAAKRLELVGYADIPAHSIAIRGPYAYLGDRELTVLDISNPVSPTVVTRTAPLTDTVWNIAVAGDYVYLAQNTDGLRIFDVSTLTRPVEVASYDSIVSRVAVSGTHAYISAGGQQFDVLDISAPLTPTHVGTSETWYYEIPDLTVSGDYVYFTEIGPKGGGGLNIDNVADPAHPFYVGGRGDSRAPYGVIISGNYAFVSFGNSDSAQQGGLQVIDISNPVSPTQTGLYWRQWEAYDIARRGRYVFLLGRYGLRVVDVSNPARPVEAGFYNKLWKSDSPSGYALAVTGTHLYVAAGEEGLFIFRYTEEEPPFHVAIEGPSSSGTGVSRRYTATVTGSTLTFPFSYTWTPPPDAGQGTAVATYTFPTGWWHPWIPDSPVTQQIVSVMVFNRQGTAVANRTVYLCTEARCRVYLPLLLR
ncbi:MAG: hypothetical protein D6796_16435 [Caldilineae bacterium]|nr:MAG: hypothetical protein D6796_16435 [Caldilineae bacterium]